MVGREITLAVRIVDVAWRALAIAVVYAVLSLGFDVLSGARLTVQTAAVSLVTGAGFALVLLPLARRLPYGLPTRVLAMLLPLYWIFSLSNLVEAYFITTIPRPTLVLGAVVLAIPSLAVSRMIAWLLPAHPPEQQPPGLWKLLGHRPLLSWLWRTLLAGLLFALVVQLAGDAWGPLISRYYHDPVYIAQAHVANPPPPAFLTWIEEAVRGVVFVLVLLPVLAVVRGRDWPSMLAVGGYVALIDATLEAWLPMLGNTRFPIGFRIGEGLDLTTDAVARGIFVAILLAMPVLAGKREPVIRMATSS